MTNNEAEYTGMIHGLEHAVSLGQQVTITSVHRIIPHDFPMCRQASGITVYGDSKLVLKQAFTLLEARVRVRLAVSTSVMFVDYIAQAY